MIITTLKVQLKRKYTVFNVNDDVALWIIFFLRFAIDENIFPPPPPIQKAEEPVIDDSKSRNIPIIHEYRSPQIPLKPIESRATTIYHQSRTSLSKFQSINNKFHIFSVQNNSINILSNESTTCRHSGKIIYYFLDKNLTLEIL